MELIMHSFYSPSKKYLQEPVVHHYPPSSYIFPGCLRYPAGVNLCFTPFEISNQHGIGCLIFSRFSNFCSNSEAFVMFKLCLYLRFKVKAEVTYINSINNLRSKKFTEVNSLLLCFLPFEFQVETSFSNFLEPCSILHDVDGPSKKTNHFFYQIA